MPGTFIGEVLTANRKGNTNMIDRPKSADPDPGGVDSVADQREREADERESLADEREAALDVREARTEARETAYVERKDEAQSILDGAQVRDVEADARDDEADGRDRAASLHSFLHDQESDATVKARRSAALDRSDSKNDRASSGADRSKLTGTDDSSADEHS